MNASKSYTKTRMLVTLAMLTAIAFIVMLVFRLPLLAGFGLGFLKFDLKDVVITIGGFIFGPVAALAMSVVVSFLEMITVSESGPIGLLMNVLSTMAFACPAAFIYKKRHGLSGAILGLLTGVACMTVIMLLWNYLVTPFYMGVPREQVAAMLASLFLPFNLIKGFINAAVIMLLYKPVVAALRRANLAPPSSSVELAAPAQKRKARVGVIIVSAVVLVSCVLVVLVLGNVI